MKNFYAVACLLVLTGCATVSNYRPIVDRPGIDAEKFERDLGECRQNAANTYGALQGAGLGGGIGVIVGSLMSGALGVKDQGATTLVGIGGALTGAAQAEKNQQEIIRNCMRGRGYGVLN